jgi:hypothetical protein
LFLLLAVVGPDFSLSSFAIFAPFAVKEPFEADYCCPLFATQNPKKDSCGRYFRGFQRAKAGCEKNHGVFTRFCLLAPKVWRPRFWPDNAVFDSGANAP